MSTISSNFSNHNDCHDEVYSHAINSIIIEIKDFNEKNIHAQCMGCNWRKKGNMRFYTIRMVEWYGLKYVKDLMECEKHPAILESGEFYLNIIEKYQIE